MTLAKSDYRFGGDTTPTKQTYCARRTYMFADRNARRDAAAKKDSLLGSLNGSAPTAFLLDSGGGACLCPSSLVTGMTLLPSDADLVACNNSSLSVSGAVRVDVMFSSGRKEVSKSVDFLVCPDIDMPVLGMTFIAANISSWNYVEGFVIMSGVRLSTVVRSSGCARPVADRVVSINTISTVAAAESPSFDRDRLEREQREDPELAPLYEMIEKRRRVPISLVTDTRSSVTRGLARQCNHLVIRDGVLCRRWLSDDKQSEELLAVMPRRRQSNIVRDAHVAASGRHLSASDTYLRIRSEYYWYELQSSVDAYVHSCKLCQLKVQIEKDGGMES